MLNIIQGDTLNITFTLSGEYRLVEALIFSSSALGMTQKLSKLNNQQ